MSDGTNYQKIDGKVILSQEAIDLLANYQDINNKTNANEGIDILINDLKKTIDFMLDQVFFNSNERDFNDALGYRYVINSAIKILEKLKSPNLNN